MSKKSKHNIAYRDEEDRAYGLAGMTISLAAFDALDRIASVTLDTEGPMVTFSSQFYFGGTQSASPKAYWRNLVEKFQLTSAMVLSNVYSRRVVHDREMVSSDILDMLYDIVLEEGRESCELEDDEVRNIFDNALGYTRRIFGNPRIHPHIRDFAGTLARRRTMSGGELRDELHLLQLI